MMASSFLINQGGSMVVSCPIVSHGFGLQFLSVQLGFSQWIFQQLRAATPPIKPRENIWKKKHRGFGLSLDISSHFTCKIPTSIGWFYIFYLPINRTSLTSPKQSWVVFCKLKRMLMWTFLKSSKSLPQAPSRGFIQIHPNDESNHDSTNSKLGFFTKKIFHDDLDLPSSFAWIPRFKHYEPKNPPFHGLVSLLKKRLEALVDHDCKNLEQRQQTKPNWSRTSLEWKLWTWMKMQRPNFNLYQPPWLRTCQSKQNPTNHSLTSRE